MSVQPSQLRTPPRLGGRLRLGGKLPSALALAALAAAAGCAVGPDYRRPPAVAVPASFKEAEGWKPAAPNEAAERGAWWEVFHDPVLNGLEAQVAISNQSLRQSAAAYEEARQAARADWTTYFPTISATGSAEREKLPSGTASSGAGGIGVYNSSTSAAFNTYAAELQASWEPDFWGRVRRMTEEAVATAQADAADLALARLSTQATLAQDYIELRALDDQKRLLNNAIADYRRTLAITQNKYGVGVAARSDVLTAQTELDATRAQAINVDVQRAQLEHAIAVLVGRPPSGFSIAPRPVLDLSVPPIPAQVPSALLERRPDIAAAERSVAAANAAVGVQVSAYFPQLSLSAAGGYEGSPLSELFSAPNLLWSLGGQASETLIDFGQIHDTVLQARAAYEASVANYRQTVLSAFQSVEDNLAELRILAQEYQVEDATVTEAAEAARIAVNEYNAGTVDFTTVVSAQVTELTNRESALSIQQNRLTSAVALIEALGGGWSTADLPTPRQVTARHSPDPAALAAPR